MKRIFVFLAVISFVFPAKAQSKRFVNQLFTETISNNGLMVTPFANDCEGNIVIPPYMIHSKKKQPVRAIKGFNNKPKITSISLPNTLLTIEDLTFIGSYNIKSIYIPASVTKIGKNVFAFCSNLKSIIVDPNNKYYSSQDGVLYNKDKTLLICYPKGKPDTSFTLPATVTSFSNDFFVEYHLLSQLQQIDVEKGNTHFSSINGVLYNKEGTDMVYYPRGRKDSTYIIDKKVDSLRPLAFTQCKNLTSVEILAPIKKLPVFCFSDCSNLTSVKLPQSLEQIKRYAFNKCRKLANVEIPKRVKKIGEYTFHRCDKLKSILLPDSLQYIDRGLFDSCANLSMVVATPATIAVEDFAFQQCTNLDSLKMPNMLGVGDYAFENCLKLRSVYMPDSFVLCRTYAFAGSSTYITVGGKNKKYFSQNGVLFDNGNDNDNTNANGIRLVHCPTSKTGDYVVPDFVKYIEVCAFQNCTSLTTIKIPASVKGIGYYKPFANCSANIVVDEGQPGYSSIDGVLFYKDKKTLLSCPTSKSGIYKIPEGVEKIRSGAFLGCNNLTTIETSGTVKELEEYSLHDMPALDTLKISKSLYSISELNFENCAPFFAVNTQNKSYKSPEGILFTGNMRKLIRCPKSKTGDYKLPSTTVWINENAFAGCNKLTSVTMDDSVTYCEKKAFADCKNLVSVKLSGALKSIRLKTFYNCEKLASIEIPVSVTEIEPTAFQNCPSLHIIKMRSKKPVDIWTPTVFSNLPADCELHVPVGSKQAYQQTIGWDTFKTIIDDL